jgi:hypothetical protein
MSVPLQARDGGFAPAWRIYKEGVLEFASGSTAGGKCFSCRLLFG